MELSGKIIAVLPLQSGTGKTGNEWKKQDYVVETHDQYPRRMCFNLWGERIDQFAIQLGEEVTVSFDIDCREYNGRWYNDIRAWKIDRVQENPMGDPQMPPMPMDMPPAPSFTPTDSKDDLPF